MRKIIAILTLLAALGLVNHSIYHLEQHRTTGQKILLKLAPVDPRALLQGDYMALQFEVANSIEQKVQNQLRKHNGNFDGFVKVQLDKRGVAQFISLAKEEEPTQAGELKLHFRVKQGKVHFATNAFFFQEGYASCYEPAAYGQLSVNPEGKVLLTALYDEQLNPITPSLACANASAETVEIPT